MIAIVDYGMGNVASVRNALQLLGKEGRITAKDEDFAEATHIILPGVGAFADGMAELRRRGIVPLLEREVFEKKKPFLGVCLGMQLLGSHGDEGGEADGLNFVPGSIRRLTEKTGYRLPHIGWDTVEHTNDPIFEGVASNDFYFVHTYVLAPEHAQQVIGTCDYGERFAVAVRNENIYGVQFHPEKSQRSGLTVLKNFVGI